MILSSVFSVEFVKYGGIPEQDLMNIVHANICQTYFILSSVFLVEFVKCGGIPEQHLINAAHVNIFNTCLIFSSVVSVQFVKCGGIPEQHLVDTLLNITRYNPRVRPVANYSDVLSVKHGLSLAQLVKLVRQFLSLFQIGILLNFLK